MIKVHYFPSYGRAEVIRMFLHIAKLEFENVDYTTETLTDVRAQGGVLEFGQLPVIEIDGKYFSQSAAVLRMLGKQHGYHTDDAFDGWRIDSILDSVNDLFYEYYTAELFTPDPELGREAFKVFYEGTFLRWV